MGRALDNMNAFIGSPTGQMSGGLIGGLFNAGMQAIFNKKQYERQVELMNKQNKFNLDMFNKQNFYNSPLNQRQLLKNAGMNPDLAYGNTGIQAATPAPAAGGNVPSPVDASSAMSTSFSAMSNLFNTRNVISDVMLKDANRRLIQIDADTRAAKNIAELKKLEADTKDTDEKRKYQEIINNYAGDLQKNELEKGNLEIAGMRTDNKIKIEELAMASYDKLMKKLDSDNHGEFIKLSLQRARLDIKAVNQQIAESIANVKLKGTQEALADQQKEKVITEIMLLSPELIKADNEEETQKILQNNLGSFWTSVLNKSEVAKFVYGIFKSSAKGYDAAYGK